VQVYTEKPNNLKQDDKKEQDDKKKNDPVADQLEGMASDLSKKN
jgi:hypothetical protein